MWSPMHVLQVYSLERINKLYLWYQNGINSHMNTQWKLDKKHVIYTIALNWFISCHAYNLSKIQRHWHALCKITGWWHQIKPRSLCIVAKHNKPMFKKETYVGGILKGYIHRSKEFVIEHNCVKGPHSKCLKYAEKKKGH